MPSKHPELKNTLTAVRCFRCGRWEWIGNHTLAKERDHHFCKRKKCQNMRQMRCNRRNSNRMTRIEYTKYRNDQVRTTQLTEMYTDKPCPECGGKVKIEGPRFARLYYRRCAKCRLKLNRRESRWFLDGDYVYA